MDWPAAPSWFNLGPAIIQTPGAGAITTLLGDYSVPASQADSASQAQGSQDHQGFGNAVLDGHVSYDTLGINTYWWYRVKLGGKNTTLGLPGTETLLARAVADASSVPPYVQQWFTEWDSKFTAARAALVPYLPPLARIRKLVLSATLGAWAPPAGGLWPSDPGLGASCVLCPVDAVILWLQRDQNTQWAAIVRANPAYLAIVPTEPYPGVSAATGIIFADSAGQLYQQTGVRTTLSDGTVTTALSNAPISIVTDQAPAYAPPTVPVQIAGQGATPVLLTPAQVAVTTGIGSSSVSSTSPAVVSAQPATTVASVVVPTGKLNWNYVAIGLGALAALVIVLGAFKGGK